MLAGIGERCAGESQAGLTGLEQGLQRGGEGAVPAGGGMGGGQVDDGLALQGADPRRGLGCLVRDEFHGVFAQLDG